MPLDLAGLLAAAWLPLPVVAFALAEWWRRLAWWLALILAVVVACSPLLTTSPAAALADLGRGLALPLAALRVPLEAAIPGARPIHARMLAEAVGLLPAAGGDWRTALGLVWRGSLAAGA